jgi:hypothetical protein
VSEDLVLVPEVEARQALQGRRLRIDVLRPFGAWIGCGTLRVLRCKTLGDATEELTVGYESYEPAARDGVAGPQA